ncbi:MAG: hypothetical protein KatS3mg085_299 [Candidatus Dojkabacteria bacterium]|nr:MAG: hypothetical protein KatS3mg085_299 [Candidatus Dojkabacteria bacterium]
MAVVTPSKIFVDPREEITSIIERVLAAEKDRVIIVIPQNSLLLSSIISLKILTRRLAKSDKLAILVTEDEYGNEIAGKAGLAVVEHISDITQETWSLAEDLKQQEIIKLNDKKNQLLSKRNVNVEEDEQSQSQDLEKDQIENQSLDIEEAFEEPEKEKDEIQSNEDTQDKEDVEKIFDEDTDISKELEKYKKPRLEHKEVEINGVKIIAGGDIAYLRKKEKSAKIDQYNFQDMDKEEIPDREVKVGDVAKSTDYMGRDFTKKVNKKNSFSSLFESFFSLKPKRKNVIGVVDPEEELRKKRRRILMAGGGVLIALVLTFGTWTYLTNVFSSVDVEVVYAKEDVKFSETIIASTENTEVDPEKLEIPAILLEEKDLNTQVTATATGQGIRGEKAKGYLSFYNIDIETPVTIPKGTRITNVVNDLVFILQEDVLLDPVTYDDLGAVEVPDPVDGLVEAEDVGDQYNFSDGDPTTFIAQGFDKDSIQIKRLVDFEGGSSETFTAVDQRDVDAVKNETKQKLLEEGTSKIKAFLPRGYRLLEETIQFEETEIRPFPDVGEEAKDGKFSLNMEGKVTALAVKEQDLEEVTRQVLAIQNEIEQIPALENYKVNIKDVVRDGGRVSFVIDSEGLFSNKLEDDEIFNLIAGKKIDEALRILSDLEEVEDVSISYSPGLVPESLQRVPKDMGRISIKTL